MKKMIFIIAIAVLLVSCGSNDESTSNDTSNNNESVESVSEEDDKKEEELSEGEELLNQIKETTDNSSKVMSIFESNYDTLDNENEKVLNKLKQYYNDAVSEYISIKGQDDLFEKFYGDGAKELKDDYKDYLNEEVKQALLDKADPVKAFLNKKGLKIDIIDEYNDAIKTSALRMEVIGWLDNNNVDYDEELKGLTVLTNDNTIISFYSVSVKRIYKIKNQNGEVLNPFQVLSEIEDRLHTLWSEQSEIHAQEAEESYEEQQRKEKEESTIRIGMTKDEVRERWGEPEDINRSIYETFTKEQWVYPNYQYLYFRNNELTTIQQ